MSFQSNLNLKFIIRNLILLIILIKSSSSDQHQQKISDVNILLPFCLSSNTNHCKDIHFRLQAFNGCFNWEFNSDTMNEYLENHLFIENSGNDKDCQNEIYIHSKVQSEYIKKSHVVWIIATDKLTNKKFSCRLGFGSIHSIQITKRFDIIHVSEVVEINIQGFDENGNLFSSLEGLSFNWSISNGVNIAEYSKLIDEKKVASKYRLNIEKEGRGFCDIVLLKGISPGVVSIYAGMNEKSYFISDDIQENENMVNQNSSSYNQTSSLSSYSSSTSTKKNLLSQIMNIYVLHPFKLYPEEVYILKSSMFKFHIKDLLKNEIFLDNDLDLFHWEYTKGSKEKCGNIKSTGEFISGNQECEIEISVYDKRIGENIQYRQYARIHIVQADKIEIGYVNIDMNLNSTSENSITNEKINELDIKYRDKYKYNKQWKLITGMFYLIKLQLKYNHYVIQNSKGKDFKLKVSSDVLTTYSKYSNKFISIIKCSPHYQICILNANQPINDTDYLNIEAFYLEDNKDLKAESQLKVYNPIKIEKFNLDFFSLPMTTPPQELRLIISGGSGRYHLKSSDERIISTENKYQSSHTLHSQGHSLNSIYGIGIGRSNVIIYDMEIEENSDNVDIKVSLIRKFEFKEEKLEAQIGDRVLLKVIGYDEDNRLYSNCTSVDVYSFYEHEVFDYNINNNHINSLSGLKNNKNSYFEEEIMTIDEKGFQLIDRTSYEKYNYEGICSMKRLILRKEVYLKFNFIYSPISTILSNSIPHVQSKNKSYIRIYFPIQIQLPEIDDLTEEYMSLINKSFIENDYIVLSPKSKIKLSFLGGSHPWEDEKLNYQNRLYLENPNHNEDKKNKNSTSTSTSQSYISIYKNEKYNTYDIECLNINQSLHLVFESFNKISTSLKKEYKTIKNIYISCMEIEYLTIIFPNTFSSKQLESINDKQILDIPQSPLLEYYLKCNSSIDTRIYAFDYLKRPFISFFNNQRENLFFEKQVIKSSQTKKKEIKSIMFSTGKTFQYIINFIDLPYIQNNTIYTTYFSCSSIEIYNGSNDFSILNIDHYQIEDGDSYLNGEVNLPIVEIIKNEDMSFIKICPRYIKSNSPNLKIIIHIKDNKIKDFIMTLTVFISNIKEIFLSNGGLIKQGDKKGFNMKIISFINDEYFPYNNIKDLLFKFNDLPNKNKFEVIRNDNSTLLFEFEAIGYVIDKYSFSVGLYYKDELIIESNSISFEVFEPIKIIPNSILLYPGSSYTVIITKGPISTIPNLKIQYLIEGDNKVSSVEKDHPTIHALSIGKNRLLVELLYNKEVLCREYVNIEVDFPTSAEIIFGKNRKIFNNSSIRLIAALKKDLVYFSSGVGSIFYEWKTDQPLVAKLKTKYENKKRCECCENDLTKGSLMSYNNQLTCGGKDIFAKSIVSIGNNIGVFVKSLSKGEANISVKIIINSLSNKQYEYQAYERLVIDDNLFVNINEFYDFNPNKSGLYLLPPNTTHDLKTNRQEGNLKFSIMNRTASNKILSLNSSGKIITSNEVGINQIIIEQYEKDNSPFVPVILSIYVCEFYSFFIEKSYELLDVDVGEEIILRIILQHEYGLLYPENIEGIKFEILESHSSIASVSLINNNQKISVKAYKPGRSNVLIRYINNPSIFDSFAIIVHASIFLPEYIILNERSHIDLLSKEPLRKESLLSNGAEWVSSNPDVFFISSQGKGVALREGSSEVRLIDPISKKAKLYTTIKVYSIKGVSVDLSSFPEYITNIYDKIEEQEKNGKEYIIKLDFLLGNNMKVMSYKENEDNLNEVSHNISYECQADDSYKDYFTAKSFINLITEEYFCILTLFPSQLNHRQEKFLNLKIIQKPSLEQSTQIKKLSIESIEGGRKYNGSDLYYNNLQQESISILKIPFISGFVIKPNVINLSSKKKSDEIKVNLNIKNIEITYQLLEDKKDDHQSVIKLDNNKLISSNMNDEVKNIYEIIVLIEESNDSLSIIKLITNEENEKVKENKDFSVKLTIFNRNSNQKEECVLKYQGKDDEVYSSRTLLIDFITILIILATLYIAINYYNTKKDDESNVEDYKNDKTLTLNNSLSNPYSNKVYTGRNYYNDRQSGSFNKDGKMNLSYDK